jgi:hypothetical protein
MRTVIGLGSAGCNIAELFEDKAGYKVKLIDVDIEGDNCFSLAKQPTPELYESNCPDMSSFFSDVDGDILFVLAGSGRVGGAALRILQQLNSYKCDVLYISPDNEPQTNTGKLQHRLTFNVLQEYARSGVLNKIYLISNLIVENLFDELSIADYYDKINKVIVDTLDSVFFYRTAEPVAGKWEQEAQSSRIGSFGVLDLASEKELCYFPLSNTDNKTYYFSINETSLKTDGKLFKKIKEFVYKDNTYIQPSYQIFSSKSSQSYCYFVAYSSNIQPLDNPIKFD